MMPEALDESARERLRLAFRECGTLMYADHQLLKAGDYATVLDRLKTRGNMTMAGWFVLLFYVYWQYRDEPGGLLSPFGIILLGTSLVSAIWFAYRRRRIAAVARLIAELAPDAPRTP